MLTAQQKLEAEKRLKVMSFEMEHEKKVKETVKNNLKAIHDLISSYKDDPKAQRALIVELSTKIAPKIIALQKIKTNFEEVQEKMKADKDRYGKQRLYAIEEKQKVQLSIQQIKETIKKIQQAIKQSLQEEAKKRIKMEQDLQKSLGQIKEKIVTFNVQSDQLEKQNQVLKGKKKQIEEKMSRLETEFKQKAQQKDQQVKKQKQELMVKLQSLEGQVSEVTQINKQFSSKQKSNFDKKLSLYLKQRKFPQFSNSFQNSARTIDACKQQLFKGVQRMNQAKQIIQKAQKDSKQWGQTFLAELKKKTQKQNKIQVVKKEKQLVRQRIINLQNKVKQLKNKPTEASS